MENESAAEFVVKPALRLAKLTEEDVFVDLRCGDGSFLFAAFEGDDNDRTTQKTAAAIVSSDSGLNNFEGTLKSNSLHDTNGAALTRGEVSYQKPKRIIGVDVQPKLISTLKQKLNAIKKNVLEQLPITLHEGDLFDFDLDKVGATCVLCTLSPEELIKLKSKLESFLKSKNSSEESQADNLEASTRKLANVGSVDVMSSKEKRNLSDNVRSEPSVVKVRNNEARFKRDQEPHEKIKLKWSSSFRKLFGLATGISSSTSSNSSYPEVPNSAATSGSIPSSEPPLLMRSTDHVMKPTRRIISVMFSIPEWTPSKVLEVKEAVLKRDESIPEWEREESPPIYVFLYDADSIN